MLHVIYRFYGGENRKLRPSFYSKGLALASLLRAARKLPSGTCELLFLNDGPVSPDLVAEMKAAGEVIAGKKLGNKGSIRTALKLAEQRQWPAQDLVWMAEDDYLYRDDALESLVAAATAAPSYDYFGLYGLIGNRQPNGMPHIDCRVPDMWYEGSPHMVKGHLWRAGLSTTSTYGVRVEALRKDRLLMNLGMETGGAFDHTICLAYQKLRPFPYAFLKSEFKEARWHFVRKCMIAGARIGFNAYVSLRQSYMRERHSLLVADPALITHMEEENMALGSNWDQVASDVKSWSFDGLTSVRL